MPVLRGLGRWVLARPWVCFVVLCLSFAVFGASTLNLFNLFKINLALIAEHGRMALADGAAVQLLELLLTLGLGMGGYVVFKACEYRLVQGLLHATQKEPD